MNEYFGLAELRELTDDLRKLSNRYNAVFTVTYDASDTQVKVTVNAKPEAQEGILPILSGAELNVQNVPRYCLRGNMTPSGPRLGAMELGNEKNRDECGWVRLADFEAVVQERDRLKALLGRYQGGSKCQHTVK